MYMLVFVTLMVALIGGYTQLYMKQASMGYSQQSGVADAMLVWHATAVDLATKFVRASSFAALPSYCTLTTYPPPPAAASFVPPTTPVPGFCPGTGGPAYVAVSKPATIATLLCSGTQGAPCYTQLPTGYQSNPYTFYSLAYQTGGRNYVLTFVPPPPVASDAYNTGALCLPGRLTNLLCAPAPPAPVPAHMQVSTTLRGLYKEMGDNSLLSPMNYGTVTAAGALTTPSMKNLYDAPNPGAITYTVPAQAVVPVGSIGIISQIAPCPATTCP